MVSALSGMEKEFIIQSLKKAAVMFGFTYFSIAVSLQSFTTFTPSVVATGLYFFTELARFYKVHSANQTARKQKKKQKMFEFLI